MASILLTLSLVVLVSSFVSAAHIENSPWKIHSGPDSETFSLEKRRNELPDRKTYPPEPRPKGIPDRMASPPEPRSNGLPDLKAFSPEPRSNGVQYRKSLPNKSKSFQKFRLPQNKSNNRAGTVSCGFHPLTPGETVTIESNNYPKKYPKKNKCIWTFQGTCPASNLSVMCSDFQLKKCKLSRMIIEGKNLKKSYCKEQRPFTAESDDNKLKISFSTKRVKKSRARGFSCTVTASAVPVNPPTEQKSVDSRNERTTCKCGQLNPITRIVGGQETTIHEYPWQVGLTYRKSPFCGGSIISDKWILTAAHCVEGDSAEYIYVLVGEHDWSTTSETSERQKLSVVDIKIHENYDDYTYDNDIALLELENALSFPASNNIAPVCLPDVGNDYANVIATITGWGTTSYGGTQSKQLMEVFVPTMTNTYCKRAYGNGITDNMICAGLDQGGKDSCQGDSGGPMVTGGDCDATFMVQIGIVSWGYGCASPKKPGVYARVTNYIDWINDKIQQSSTCPRP